MVESQPGTNFNPNTDNPYPSAKFSPSVAIIIVLLIVALFFIGFFSIYIRQCTDRNNSGNSVRNVLAIARRAANNGGARGLEASVIETFPTFTYAEVKDHKIGKGVLECAVCLNEFEDEESLRLIPKCDHVFHPECIDSWLENHVTCPVCRADLTPQPDDELYRPPESNQENPENDGVGRNEDVAIQVDGQQESVEVKPEVKRVWSFKYLNRTRRTDSVKRGGKIMFASEKFRSHSTGHSLVQPVDNMDRFTLRLPQEIRKEMMHRASLNRARSVAVGFPRDRSTRRWFRDGSTKDGGGSSQKIQQSEPDTRSDRWLFSKAAPFFSRVLSIKANKVVSEKGETSNSTVTKIPSFRRSEPKNIDERYLMSGGPVEPSV